MAKKSICFRNIFKKISIENSFFKTIQLKAKLKKYFILLLLTKLQTLPYNSSLRLYKNRCSETGRAKAYFRAFGICRNILRESITKKYYINIKKASW